MSGGSASPAPAAAQVRLVEQRPAAFSERGLFHVRGAVGRGGRTAGWSGHPGHRRQRRDDRPRRIEPVLRPSPGRSGRRAAHRRRRLRLRQARAATRAASLPGASRPPRARSLPAGFRAGRPGLRVVSEQMRERVAHAPRGARRHARKAAGMLPRPLPRSPSHTRVRATSTQASVACCRRAASARLRAGSASGLRAPSASGPGGLPSPPVGPALPRASAPSREPCNPASSRSSGRRSAPMAGPASSSRPISVPIRPIRWPMADSRTWLG